MTANIGFTNEMNILTSNLNKMMLYYFSEEILNLNIFIDAKKQLNKETNLNIIFFLNQNSEVVITETVTTKDYSVLLSKKNWLDANVYYLLDLKTNLNPEPFEYLVAKYSEILSGYLNIATILLENYEMYCLTKSGLLKIYLDTQLQFLNFHKADIKNQFFKPKYDFIKLPDALKDKPNEVKEIGNKPRLRDVIIKGNAVAIEKILVKTFNRSQNLDINRMFTALVNLQYIIMKHGDREFLIECLNNSIEGKKYNSRNVFKSTINTSIDNQYKVIRNTIINLLENLN